MNEDEIERQDTEKFRAVIIALQVVKSTFWFTSIRHKKLYGQVCLLIDKIINYIKDKS
jgi:hypothetical protein